MARRSALPLAVLLALTGASGASAHGGDPGIQTLITAVRPALPGVSVAVQPNVVPAVTIENRGRRPVDVLDDRGIPFLRVTPTAALGNLASPFLYRSSAPGGEAAVPEDVQRGRRAQRFVLLSRGGSWGFYDTRIPDIATVPASVRAAGAPAVLARFRIPLRYAGKPAVAEGEVEYLPPRGGAVAHMTSPAHPAPGLTVALLPGRYPDLFLANAGTQTVTVLGAAGEPFAEIGPAGVRVNLRSAIYAADARVRGATAPPAGSGPPDFRRVSRVSSFDWYDPRARLQAHWSVPLRVGSRLLAITGTIGLAPATTTDGPSAARRADRGTPVAAIAAAAAVLAAAIGTGVIHTRRK